MRENQKQKKQNLEQGTNPIFETSAEHDTSAFDDLSIRRTAARGAHELDRTQDF